MKKIIYLLFVISTLFSLEEISPQSIYQYSAVGINGDTILFNKFINKKILIVNVASNCGYTSQYKDLQSIHEKYGDKVVVLGFPSNNFFRQEPGTNKEINTFCKTKYGVTFQMFEKISVKGKRQHPIYKWLSSKELNGWNDKSPSWNFNKYLIDEKGMLINYFKSNISPLDTVILNRIK